MPTHPKSALGHWRSEGNVRFGSKADIGQPMRDVRFTPKADMFSVKMNVCFVPEADLTFSANWLSDPASARSGWRCRGARSERAARH
jgi:hypothetical protein